MRKILVITVILCLPAVLMAQAIKFEFTNVRFRTGSAVIDPATYPALDSLAQFVLSSGAAVEISGHTDNLGSPVRNRALSQRRAEAVRTYLVTRRRVPAGQLTAKGFGPMMPVASNATAEDRAQNRRVEVTILSKIRTARVSFLSGNAVARKPGISGWVPVALNHILTLGDEVVTDSTGRLEISFDNGSKLKVLPRSDIVIAQQSWTAGGREASTGIGIKLGKVAAKISKLQMQKESFSIATPTAVAGVRGTEFVVESRPDQAALLSVWEDNVLWRGQLSGSMDKPIPAGQGCRCLPGQMPEPPVDLPKPPMPQQPAANDTLYYNPDRPKSLSLAWQTVAGTRAHLVVARDAELNDVVAELVTADQAFRLPAPKVDRLYWQLNSVDSLGFEGQPWPLRSFEVRRKLDGPNLNILRPQGGEKVGKKTVVIEGMTDPKSEVTVNGRKVALDQNWNFIEPVALKPGQNAITVVSTDRADNATTAVLNLSCSPFRRFWVGPYGGALKLLGGEWDMSTIGFSGGVRFLAGLNERLSFGLQAGYAQVGCIMDQAFEPRGPEYQTTLLSGALVAQVCPMPDLVVAPYATLFLGAISWTNQMDTTVLYKGFGTPSSVQEDLSPHAGLALGARYLATETVLVFLEAAGGYLATNKYNVGHYDANNLTATIQAGVQYGF